MSIRPRHETMEHSFHLFAVKDRCNTFSLADNPALCGTSNCDLTTVLPTIDNDKISHGNASVLAAWIIRKRFKFFAVLIQSQDTLRINTQGRTQGGFEGCVRGVRSNPPF